MQSLNMWIKSYLGFLLWDVRYLGNLMPNNKTGYLFNRLLCVKLCQKLWKSHKDTMLLNILVNNNTVFV